MPLHEGPLLAGGERHSTPASAFSASLLIAVLSLAVRDSFTSFAIVWAASFVILSGFVIAVWALTERQRVVTYAEMSRLAIERLLESKAEAGGSERERREREA